MESTAYKNYAAGQTPGGLDSFALTEIEYSHQRLPALQNFMHFPCVEVVDALSQHLGHRTTALQRGATQS